jgi:NADH:ubiquinone oxidoreductase subunit 3 (subunit A)
MLTSPDNHISNQTPIQKPTAALLAAWYPKLRAMAQSRAAGTGLRPSSLAQNTVWRLMRLSTVPTDESGMAPIGTARKRFNVRFYLIAMTFLLFDVEIIFLYPWAVTFPNLTPRGSEGLIWLARIAFFMLTTIVMYLYGRRKGVFNRLLKNHSFGASGRWAVANSTACEDVPTVSRICSSRSTLRTLFLRSTRSGRSSGWPMRRWRP